MYTTHAMNIRVTRTVRILVTDIYWSRIHIGHGHILFTDIYWSWTYMYIGLGHILVTGIYWSWTYMYTGQGHTCILVTDIHVYWSRANVGYGHIFFELVSYMYYFAQLTSLVLDLEKNTPFEVTTDNMTFFKL